MANEEQLSILKQGVHVWNEWREENLDVEIDLSEADLNGADLRKVSLSNTNLVGAHLRGANLWLADLRLAHLVDANLAGANFNETNLSNADLFCVKLVEAILMGANLSGVNLHGADLSMADLRAANLWSANLEESNFSKAKVGHTIFGRIDLSDVTGLENVCHDAPSPISTDTIVRSEGKIPEIFLRGCGLSDWEIEMVKLYNPGLSNDERNKILYKIYDLQATRAIQISPLFISYSHGDSKFVDLIDKHLTELGIRFWRDIHDLKAGKIEKQIDQAISPDRTVLLVLSEHSLKSDWVEHEVRTARGIEKTTGRDTLCPVALDDSWKSSPWPARVMEQIMEYNILDFSAWEDDVKFEGVFRKLIDGLELFYKG